MQDYYLTDDEKHAMLGAVLGIVLGFLAITGLIMLLMTLNHNANTTPEKPQCQCACMK